MIRNTLSQAVDFLRTYPSTWMAALFVTLGADLAMLLHGPGVHHMGTRQITIIVLKVFGICWVGGVMLRQLMQSPDRHWYPDWGIAVFFVWEISIGLLAGVTGIAFRELARPLAPALSSVMGPDILRLILLGLATPVVDLVALLAMPWMVAFVTRLSPVPFRETARAILGLWPRAAAAYLALIFPLFAGHLALTAWLQRTHLIRAARAGWTIIDGAGSALLAILLLALYASVCRSITCFPQTQRIQAPPRHSTRVRIRRRRIVRVASED